MAVEPQEYDRYCETIPEAFLKKLPFSNLGLGSYPARNWCWEHSITEKHVRHFLFDDNIYGFVRFNKGKRVKCTALESLLALQNFTDRFTNVAVSGFNYRFFVDPTLKKPFFINTHVYSAMLINNSIPHRWRLKYNEDVDLCLQVLHDGLCTILMNAFLCNKVSTTAKMKGGNQSELYQNNDPLKKALKSCSLKELWPQYVKVVHRFGRPHHQVSWGKFFKQPLMRLVQETSV